MAKKQSKKKDAAVGGVSGGLSGGGAVVFLQGKDTKKTAKANKDKAASLRAESGASLSQAEAHAAAGQTVRARGALEASKSYAGYSGVYSKQATRFQKVSRLQKGGGALAVASGLGVSSVYYYRQQHGKKVKVKKGNRARNKHP